MDTEGHAAGGDRGRTHEYYRDPITMSFDPNECSPTSSPSRQPSRIQAIADSDDALLAKVQQRQQQQQEHHHQRQQSAPDIYAENRTPSPTSRARHRSQDMPFTGDGRGSRRQDNSPGRFGGWLNTPSAGDAAAATPAVSPDTTPTPKSATPSRLGFFASLTGRLTTQSPTTPNITITSPAPHTRATDDDLLNLDVETALYPSPTDRDAFSPAAYKNLQQNATGLLRRMQDAYRARTVAAKELVAEREAQREEAEETELRVRSLRAQLESMAAKAQEQELAMRRLVAELRFERSAREEEREGERKERARLEREVERARLMVEKRGDGDEGGLAEGPLITEDLCVDEDHERKRWRKSDGTVRSDLSIDTDGESAESESIFSRSRSPTAMTCATESEANAELLSVRTPPVGLKKGPAQQLTAFQRLVKGISGDGASVNGGGAGGVDGCSNCRGQDSSVAWDTVSLLRDENRGLKHRVAELEVVVDGALDVVNGIGLS